MSGPIWDVYCKDCDSSLGLAIDRGIEPTRAIVRYVSELVAVHGLQQKMVGLDVEVQAWGHMLNLAWLVKHQHCRLKPRDDNDRCADECGKEIESTEIGARHFCRIFEGHSGPCKRFPRR